MFAHDDPYRDPSRARRTATAQPHKRGGQQQYEPDPERDDAHHDTDRPLGIIRIGVLDDREAWARQAEAGKAEHEIAEKSDKHRCDGEGDTADDPHSPHTCVWDDGAEATLTTTVNTTVRRLSPISRPHCQIRSAHETQTS